MKGGGVDTLDGFLLHSPPADVLANHDLWDALATLQRSDKVHAYGVSCDTMETLVAAVAIPGVTLLELPFDVLAEIQGGPLERRKRAAARGGRLLDALDELKIGLLEGTLPRAAVERLAREAREQRTLTDDPGLDAILGEIETRAAVEMAKLEANGLAA